MRRLGVSEFNISGTLKTWTVVDRLHTITRPTLVINGVDDEAQDECVSPLFEKIPKAKWIQFAKSSHMPFYEEPERYFQIVGEFLKE
jgi:pimeloyl-ACP methyl ester carboxylesterase